MIDIRTLEVIGGSLPRRALNLTVEWAIEHREELMAGGRFAVYLGDRPSRCSQMDRQKELL